MRNNAKLIIVEFVSSLFIVLFVYAALSKLLDFQKFLVELGKSPLLNGFNRTISIIVPIIELVVSVFLAIKRFQLYALYFALSLMFTFSAYIVAILEFSPYIPCSCGGILQNMSWKEHLIFNLGFIVINIVAILEFPKKI